MKHIVSFSGGKDSTAMLIMMLEKGIKIDEIIFIDTTMEFDEMYTHINKLKTNLNIQITRLSFDFKYYMFDHEKRNGSKGYAWCGRMCRWGTSMKKQLMAKYIKEKYDNKIIEFQGIAYDEPERIGKNNDKKWDVKYPLYDWGIEESEALQYCYDKGYNWNGLYKWLDRVSCWCCWNKNLKELKGMYFNKPDKWIELKAYEKRIGIPFKQNYSLEELEQRFKREGIQTKLF